MVAERCKGERLGMVQQRVRTGHCGMVQPGREVGHCVSVRCTVHERAGQMGMARVAPVRLQVLEFRFPRATLVLDGCTVRGKRKRAKKERSKV